MENRAMLGRLGGIHATAAGALILSAIIAGCGGATASGTPAATATPTASAPPAHLPTSSAVAAATPTAIPSPTGSGLPSFRHVYVIIMENKEYGRIVGSGAAPYENQLMARYGQASDFYAETHPSEPNYIALTSGGLQGTGTDGAYDLSVPNLFDQIEAAGRTWHVFAQGYPGNCYQGSQSAVVVDGPGAAGDYVRKHNPAISYTSISDSQTRCANITRLDGFDPGAADFEMIIPNEINDMHSSSVAAGDAFLAAFVPQIVNSPAFIDSVLFITWDEGDTNDDGGGHIATIIASPGMAPGSHFDGHATHYSMLRTIELAWGMPLLGAAATATTIKLQY
jgi:phosphatidylinositol-3-phosphatase